MKVPSSLLPDRITVRPAIGSGAYGPSYGPEVVCRARLERRRRVIRRPGGVEVVSEATATIRPDVLVGEPARAPAVEDLVAVGPITYDVMDVRDGQGLRRPSHLELLLGAHVTDEDAVHADG